MFSCRSSTCSAPIGPRAGVDGRRGRRGASQVPPERGRDHSGADGPGAPPAGISTLPRVRALRRFTVRAQLPEQLAPLQKLATNLRWSWHPPTQDMFARLDHDAWERVGHDPVRLLGEMAPPGSPSSPPTPRPS